MNANLGEQRGRAGRRGQRAPRAEAARRSGLFAAAVLSVLVAGTGRGADARGSRAAAPAVAAARESSVSSEGAPSAAALPTPSAAAPPVLLSETGLYVPGSTREVAPENRFYVPQYPLWSDGATKRRWVWLPAGTQIDASKADEWSFPVGTRFWKEFSFDGKPAETRYLERLPSGAYLYATYVWDADLGDARLAPPNGVRAVRELFAGVEHDVPSDGDCRACHEGRSSPVLGFNALQLSSERDPRAPHREAITPDAIDLTWLSSRGLLRGLPSPVVAPRIEAPSAVARAAAGYLYGNCSSCHNAAGSLSTLGLDFDQSALVPGGYARMLRSVSQSSFFTLPGESGSRRVVPGEPQRSALFFRVSSRAAASQMPPLGTKLQDASAVQLLRRWILELPRFPPAQETNE